MSCYLPTNISEVHVHIGGHLYLGVTGSWGESLYPRTERPGGHWMGGSLKPTTPVQIDSYTVCGKFRGTQGEPGNVVPHGNNPLYSSSSTARCGPTSVTVHARLAIFFFF